MIMFTKKRVAPQHYNLMASQKDRVHFGRKVYQAITQDMPRNEEELDEVLNALYNRYMLSFDDLEEAYSIAHEAYMRHIEENE